MIFFLTGLILSKVYSYFILPKKCNEAPKINPNFYPIMFKGMLIVPITKKKALHIHHWLIYLFICFSGLFFKIPKIIIGFSFGLLVQGLLYEDSLKFICDNPYN